jgi:hypothetical protein
VSEYDEPPVNSRRVALNEFLSFAKTIEGTRKERTQAFLVGDPLEALLGLISSGVSLRDACAMADVVYSTLQKRLTEDAELRPRYEGARTRQAEAVIDEIAEIERQVEEDNLDPKAAQVLIGSKQWRAERLNPKRYGPRSFQHIETVDQTQLHLEAVRLLARERREALTVSATVKPELPAIEASYVDVTPVTPGDVDG